MTKVAKSFSFLHLNKNRKGYRSVIGGNSRNDEHEKESDQEFHDKSLHIRTGRDCSCKMVTLASEYKSQSSTGKYGSNKLGYYICWYLQLKMYENSII